ncbi:MAG: hypothetical protein K2Q25_01720 [Mycobacteriaceae bacterium]|nr:hypothetical protein [Mycobacteriaceae bacterium]
MTVRHHSGRFTAAEASADRLPADLRSFDNYLHPNGLRDYLTALSDHVAPHDPMPVMKAAGLSAAEWFRHKLTNSTS